MLMRGGKRVASATAFHGHAALLTDEDDKERPTHTSASLPGLTQSRMGVIDIQICLTSLEGEELLNIAEKVELENANHDRNIKQLNHSLPNGTAGGTDGPALALPTRDGEGMHLLQGLHHRVTCDGRSYQPQGHCDSVEAITSSPPPWIRYHRAKSFSATSSWLDYTTYMIPWGINE